jgi:hypothetical protein
MQITAHSYLINVIIRIIESKEGEEYVVMESSNGMW